MVTLIAAIKRQTRSLVKHYAKTFPTRTQTIFATAQSDHDTLYSMTNLTKKK